MAQAIGRSGFQQSTWDWRLWRQWVIANALGELFGLGLTATSGWLTISQWGESTAIGAVIGLAGLMVLAGTLSK
jgi:hypothetical protein